MDRIRVVFIAVMVLAALLLVSACTPLVNHPGPLTREPGIRNGHFIAGDGAMLPLRSWLPQDRPVKAVIVGVQKQPGQNTLVLTRALDAHSFGQYRGEEKEQIEEKSWLERFHDWKRHIWYVIRNFFRRQFSDDSRASIRQRQGESQKNTRIGQATLFAQVPVLNSSQLVARWRQNTSGNYFSSAQEVPLELSAADHGGGIDDHGARLGNYYKCQRSSDSNTTGCPNSNGFPEPGPGQHDPAPGSSGRMADPDWALLRRDV